MRRITVLIDGQSTTITLKDSIVVCGERSLCVRNATVYWAYNNISESDISAYRYGITTYRLQPGFWTFSMIKKSFEEIKEVELVLNAYNGRCYIFNNSKGGALSFLNTKNKILEILGITTGHIWRPGERIDGDKPVDPLLGLKYLKIHCDIADSALDINEKGKGDSIITTIPVSLQQSLYGSVQNIKNIKNEVKINKGVINQLKFYVTDQDDNPINVGKILLDCYIV